MSSVLQAITRDPICARFFLSDGTTRRDAPSAARIARWTHRDGLQVRPEDDHCLACELDALINAAFADGDVEAQKEPCLAAFLHAWWRHAPEHLARQGSRTRTSSSSRSRSDPRRRRGTRGESEKRVRAKKVRE